MKYLRTKLGATLAVAVAVVAVAAVVASALSATKTTEQGAMPGMAMKHSSTSSQDGSMGAMKMSGAQALQPGADGTSATAAGLTLQPDRTELTTGAPSVWSFRIVGADGRPVTRFTRDQTKLLHLIVVRDDLTGYQHVHPTLGAGGTFRIAITLPAPGRYRAIADFTTAGKRYALGTELRAPGAERAVPLPAVSRQASVDGYDVKVAYKPLMAGASSRLTFTISKDGQPVTGLQPYLGAYGHLVALTKGSLAYSHVHPQGEDRSAGTISFDADFPAATAYRLFVQFRAGGAVHTGAFTVDVAR